MRLLVIELFTIIFYTKVAKWDVFPWLYLVEMFCPWSNLVEKFFLSPKWSKHRQLFGSCRSNLLSLGRDGRNIPFFGRVDRNKNCKPRPGKLHHICFGSRKVANIFRLHKFATYQIRVKMVATYLFLERTKSHYICFGSRRVAQIIRSHKVATYPFWVAMVATYLIWVTQSRNIPNLDSAKPQHGTFFPLSNLV